MNPASCALWTLSLKEHPPLIINRYGEFMSSSIELFVKGEQASSGDARNNVPCSPDSFTGGADKNQIKRNVKYCKGWVLNTRDNIMDKPN